MKRLYTILVCIYLSFGLVLNISAQNNPFNKQQKVAGQSSSSFVKNAQVIKSKVSSDLSSKSIKYNQIKHVYDEKIWLLNLDKLKVSARGNANLESISKNFINQNKSILG